MKPDELLQGVSVNHGIAVCHGCGLEESFSGEFVEDEGRRKPRYKLAAGEWDRYVVWYKEHKVHRAPAPEVV